MPFEQIAPRPFTPAGFVTYAPKISGVYGISNAREWLYIGSSDDIRAALRDHFEHDGRLMQKQPTGFVFEVCDASLRPNRQNRLVLEYEPVCNRSLPSSHRHVHRSETKGVV